MGADGTDHHGLGHRLHHGAAGGQGVGRGAGGGGDDDAVSGNRTKLNFAEKLRTIFRESITSIACAQNIVVIKTMPGLASAACSALDNMDITYMVGSLAGDDTAFLLMQDAESAAAFCEEIRAML